MTNHYDAIIIGGRIAGSSLAMRLGRQNLKVLLIDRANFPSLPPVPSEPIIHASVQFRTLNSSCSENDPKQRRAQRGKNAAHPQIMPDAVFC